MNPFTAHPRQQGVSYSEHFLFAMGIAARLFHSVMAFSVHAIFPFIDIDASLDLEATAAFIQQRNEWIEAQKQHGETTSAEVSWANGLQE